MLKKNLQFSIKMLFLIMKYMKIRFNINNKNPIEIKNISEFNEIIPNLQIISKASQDDF